MTAQEAIDRFAKEIKDDIADLRADVGPVAVNLATLTLRVTALEGERARLQAIEVELRTLIGQLGLLKWLIGIGVPLAGVVSGIVLHFLR